MRSKPTGYFDTAGRVICEGDIVRYATEVVTGFDRETHTLTREVVWKVEPVRRVDSVYVPLKSAIYGSVTIVKSKED